VTEDKFAGEVSRKGHGLQRAIIFAALFHLARVRGTPKGDEGEGRQPDLILAIEEPELYQHPPRCRQISKVLRELANVDAPAAQTQVLLTTHSPYFLELEHFDDIVLTRKEHQPSGAAVSTTSRHSFDEVRAEWARCCDIDVGVVTLRTLLARFTKPFLATASEGFFADYLVLVEGIGDASLLWAVAERREADWNKLGVAVVPVNGKANLGAPWLVFKSFGIPTYVVFDGDRQNEGKKEAAQTIKDNKFFQRVLGVKDPMPFPGDSAGDSAANFEYEIEDHCRVEIGEDVFSEVIDDISAELGIRPKDVFNYSVGAVRFVELIYERGKTLSMIEKIVERITANARAVANTKAMSEERAA
jgi:putative ATP-dependent endonuclease of the OLD family